MPISKKTRLAIKNSKLNHDPLGIENDIKQPAAVNSSDPLGLGEGPKPQPKQASKVTNNRAKRRARLRDGKKWKNKSIKRRIIEICACLFVVGAIGVVGLIAYVIAVTPPINAQNINSLLSMSSTIYDDAGVQVKDIYSGDGEREIVKHDDIPKGLFDAFIAVEDKTFYTHSGFNFTRLAGALLGGLQGKRIGGTSTITQQLARNIWLTQSQFDRSLFRKVQEAYYSIQIEKQLSKDEIITAYLNTIPLGNRSYGVSAASKSYFGKELKDLTPIECAALASLPKAPSQYSMIKVLPIAEVSSDDTRRFNVDDSEYAYIYNDAVEDRVKLVLRLMHEQGLLSKEDYETAKEQNLRDFIHPTKVESTDEASFFIDYCIDQIADDLIKSNNGIKTRDEALNVIYNGGLNIYTTLNTKMQDAVDLVFNDKKAFPKTILTRLNSEGNIMNPKPGADTVEEAGDSIMLYKNTNLFDDAGNFYLHDGEYQINEDGSLTIFKDKRLSFFNQSVLDEEGNKASDVGIEIKAFYKKDDSGIFVINGGTINIPRPYKKRDADGNVIVSAKLFKDYPNIIILGGDRPQIPASSIILRQQILQPQGASVVLENDTGYIKAMTGGRDIKGEKNFNRALSPHQPGSSIKPIATYGPAIEMSAKGEEIKEGEASWGKYWSPLSIIEDKPLTINGKQWPKNWYGGSRGKMSMRKAIEQSANTIAVATQISVGNKKSTEFLRKVGISTVVAEADDGVTDMNPAALALGGMTKGTTPLEMASAYGTFANGGEHMKTLTYTKVVSKTGKELLTTEIEGEQAMDPGTAFIMNDMLRTVVTAGVGSSAQLNGTPTAGKTGTTSDGCDFWFVGNTPKYSCSVWMGGDSKLPMQGDSHLAAAIWKLVMTPVVAAGESGGEFKSHPENVVSKTIGGRKDYFIKGTEPTSLDTGQTTLETCENSGLRATPWCPGRLTRDYFTLDDSTEKPPEFYCNLHNKDTVNFPLPPGVTLDNSYFDQLEQQKQNNLNKPKNPTNSAVGNTNP
jgi:penicillin-binding protein 1A